MVEHRLDWDRAARTGTSEAVLCEPKTAAQIDAIVAHAAELERRLLLTRLGERKFARLAASARDALDYDAPSRTAILGGVRAPRGAERIAIVSGGTSDARVAGEGLDERFELALRRLFVDDSDAARLVAGIDERIDERRVVRAMAARLNDDGSLDP